MQIVSFMANISCAKGAGGEYKRARTSVCWLFEKALYYCVTSPEIVVDVLERVTCKP